MGEEGVALEDGVHRSLVRREPGQVLPVDQNLALVGELEPTDDPQQRRLPATARAEDRDELALEDVEVDAAEGLNVAEPASDAPGSRSRRGGRDRRRGRLSTHRVGQPLILDQAAFQSSSDVTSPSRSSGGSA